MRALFIGSILFIGIGSCGTSEDEIRAQIQSANTCSQSSDCVNVGTYCPYGCDVVVNKSEADRIRSLLESNNHNSCAYDCRALNWIACTSGACVPQYQ